MVKHSNSAQQWSLGVESRHAELSGALTIDPSEPICLGALIRDRRLGLGLTLGSLADRAGVAKGYLSQIETGVREKPPSDDVIRRIEGVLSFAPGELVQVAAWHRVPSDVRSEFVENRRAARRLRQIVSSRETDLDKLHASGELRRLVDRIDPSGAGAQGGGTAGSITPVRLPYEVPLINNVPAGQPTEFTDLGYPARVADDYIRVPDLSDPDAFAARVVGDSMFPDYKEGDVVVFSPATPVRSGVDCFARLEPDHATTFKRVFFETDDEGAELIRLQPLNSSYPPQVVPRDRVAGLYRAVTVMRALDAG
ncbi:MAG: S24 family peptidase [Planctomycetota bacterium]